MANTFKNKGLTNIYSKQTFYTAPSSTVTTILGLTIANVTSSDITASVFAYDSSGSLEVHLIKNATIPVGGSLVVIGGNQKVILETSDEIRVETSASNSGDAFLSYLEQT